VNVSSQEALNVRKQAPMLDKAAKQSCFSNSLDGNALNHDAFALVVSDLFLAARQHALVTGLALQLSSAQLGMAWHVNGSSQKL
jgi:hypothetical protein